MTALAPTYLRCEYRVDPLGIDAARPRLSWILHSDERSERQTAYQVLVADSPEALDQDRATLWDSGVVETDATRAVYAGRALGSRGACHWKVRVWNRDGRPSGWSAPAVWTVGPLTPGDWRARWIGYDAPYAPLAECPHVAMRHAGGRPPRLRLFVLIALAKRLMPPPVKWLMRRHLAPVLHALMTRRFASFVPVLVPCPYVRKEFTASAPVRATLYASALGIYELQINGRRVGDDYLTPGWTDYGRRLYYQTYDVTPLLREGPNAVGAIVADGWYAGYIGTQGERCHYGVHPRLLMQLEIVHADGSTTTVVTDPTWKATTGPHLEADLLMGETYDARKELEGWSEPGYDDAAWAAVTVDAPSAPRLEAMAHPPVRRLAEVKPVRIWSPAPGCHVFDMGRNFAGWARLRVRGDAGTRVVLRFGERLNPDGTLYRTNLRHARATDTYVLKGAGEETWEPRFTYHGFQYVELTGYPGTPDLETLTGIVAHSALPPAGEFGCSSELVNSLYENIVWTQRANFVDIPTDCPQRDERLGWLGDAQVFARTASYNMDVATFFGKWLLDIADAQSAEGAYPDLAPLVRPTRDGSPGWADAGIIVPWTLYWVYGDERVVEAHYEKMKAWIEYVREANPKLLWTRRTAENHGEWLATDEGTPKTVLATAYFAYSVGLLAKLAAAIGRSEDAARYGVLARAIRGAFTEAFVAADGRIKGDTQTCYVLALRFDLVPETLRARVARRLVDAIERAGGHLTTGFFGTAYLGPVLVANGYLDVAYGLLLNETFPSWGYCIRRGATSVWERWDGWTEEKGFQNPMMNSFCHFGFGTIGEWLFTTVAGIDTEEPGFRRIIIRPRPGGALTHAWARYRSVSGLIAVSWAIEADAFALDVTVPSNTSATVFVPTRDPESVTEGGRPVRDASDVDLVGIDGDAVRLTVGSGRYTFRAAAR